MKLRLLIILVTIFGCSSSKKNIEHTEEGKYTYSSGNLSGIDYIMIKKTKHNKRQFWVVINCNHYVRGLGKVFYMSKEEYSLDGNYLSTVPFIKDTSMLSKLNLKQGSNKAFVKLSEEEYEVIQTSFLKYPALTTKYSLNAV